MFRGRPVKHGMHVLSWRAIIITLPTLLLPALLFSYITTDKHQAWSNSGGGISRHPATCEALPGIHRALQQKRGTVKNASKMLDLVSQRRKALSQLMKNCSEYWEGTWQDKLKKSEPIGVIMSAGNRKPLVNAFVTLNVLRTVGCTLPITLFHYGKEFLPSTMRFFEAHIDGLSFINIEEALQPFPDWHIPLFFAGRPDNRDAGYAIKMASLYLAPYRQVFFLDVDSMPLKDPSPLFTIPQYKERGNLFWPDISRWRITLYETLSLPNPHDALGPDPANVPLLSPEDAKTHKAAGNKNKKKKPQNCSICRSDGTLPPSTAETGQFLFNREQHYDVLEWAFFLATHMDFLKGFEGVLGDKDLFRLAFTLAKKSDVYLQTPYAPSMVFLYKPESLYPVPKQFEEPHYAMMGVWQYNPLNGSDVLFWHRAGGEESSAKFPSSGDPGIAGQPPTHFTPPFGAAQAGRLSDDALASEFVREVTCGETCACSYADVQNIDEVCAQRDDVGRETDPFPVTFVRTPHEHPIHRVARIAKVAYEFLPFHETKDTSGSS